MSPNELPQYIPFQLEEIEQSIPARFEHQVRRSPTRIAVRTRECRLSYGELNASANRIARAILSVLGERQELVALLLPQGALGIAGILGVLKAGKIYTTLDPSHPPDRLTSLLRQLQPALLLTDPLSLSVAAEIGATAILNLDDIPPTSDSSDPGLDIAPDALVWILNTSGSTGEPKGVVQCHRNALHLLRNYTNRLRIAAGDRLTLLHSFLTMDLFGALLNGATLCPFDVKREGLQPLARWLRENEITLFRAFTTTFRHFAATLATDDIFPTVRMVHLGGETVYARDVELFRRHFLPESTLVNWFGSNEAGDISCHFLDHETALHGDTVPVGHPIETNEVALLDDAGNEVGSNTVGEISVKSRYLAVEYWRRPDLTAAAFLPDPNGKGLRTVRTGDMGRFNADGCLEYLGRRDQTARIRGQWVEVSAVERVLLALGGVREVAVVTRPDSDGEEQLVAYIVPADQSPPTVSQLRRCLSERLPAGTVPSRFVLISALPVAASGKLDRRALPDPDSCRPALDTLYRPPRTSIETAVAAIWEEVLGITPIGIDDDFFELGGHSLSVTRVTSRFRKAWQIELPIGEFFDTPTVAGIALIVTKSLPNQQDEALEQLVTRVEMPGDK